MNKAKSLIIGVIVLVLIYAYRVFEASKTLVFGAGKISKVSLKNGTLSWLQVVTITNGDFTPIPVRSVSISNYIGSVFVGSSILQTPFVISGSGVSLMPLLIQIPLTNLFATALSTYQQIKNGSMKMRFAGEISSIGVSIPLDQTFILNIPKF